MKVSTVEIGKRYDREYTSYNINNSRKNEIRLTAVLRIKRLDFGLQN